MQEAIQKTSALVEAMEYIRRFRDRIVVVKLGGSILDNLELQQKLLRDIVFMSTVGMRPLIVHGGGKAITQAMNESGLEPVWVQGRRYTDERTLALAEHVLVNKMNTVMCETIRQFGGRAMGLHSLSSCVVFADPLRLENGDGRKVDLGLVGKVTGVNGDLLITLCNSGVIPVISPIALSRLGGKLNVNADSVAGEVAAAVQAEKLVVLSDTHGILTDMNNPDSRLSSVNEQEIEKMIRDGIITKGMLPKVQACLTALAGGVRKAHIIDGQFEHSLLLEIYTDKGIGTQIIK